MNIGDAPLSGEAMDRQVAGEGFKGVGGTGSEAGLSEWTLSTLGGAAVNNAKDRARHICALTP